MRSLSICTIATLSFLLVPGLSNCAQSGLVVNYAATDSASISPAVQGTGVTGNNLVGGSGLTFDDSGFEWSGWDSSSLTEAATANEYFEWGFTSTAPYNLTDLDIRYDTSVNGPGNLAIQASINGSGFQTIYTDDAVTTSGLDAADIDLSSFSNVTSAVFRLFAWNADNDNGRLLVENSPSFGNAAIVVNGVAVPEPSSLVLMGLGGCGIFVVTYRRKRKRRTNGITTQSKEEAPLENKRSLCPSA